MLPMLRLSRVAGVFTFHYSKKKHTNRQMGKDAVDPSVDWLKHPQQLYGLSVILI